MGLGKPVFLASILIIAVFGALVVFRSFSSSVIETQGSFGVVDAFPDLSFSRPVGFYHAGDDTDRVFVLEQQGIIYVFDNSEKTQTKDVFLDISEKVLFGGEQGLLGLAFHPDFVENGLFFVDYATDNPARTIIARYSVSQDPSRADESSEVMILEVSQPFGNHNGGQIVFGPDGYLYIGLGDGGSGGDPFGNAQDLSSLLGSILRVDVDSSSDTREYGIPEDNPFFGNQQGFREEIFAYGLRNPWRFSFDPQTGMLWTADVGQNSLEEIDIIQAGKNYGWNIMEGTQCYSPSSNCDQTGLELPIWEYGRSLGNSVTGGFVYRCSTLTDLVGSYIYGDYGSGRVWALSYIDGVADNELLFDSTLNIASFGVDALNEIYICSFDGKIYKLSSNAVAPNIGSPVHSPLEPLPDQQVRVSVDVTSINTLTDVVLSYSNDDVWTNVTMTLTDGRYAANIPAMADQTNIRYKIVAYDSMGNVAVKDNLGNNYQYTVIPEFSSPIIIVLAIILGITAIMVIKSKQTFR